MKMNGKVKNIEPVGDTVENAPPEGGDTGKTNGTQQVLMLVNPLTPAPFRGRQAVYGVGKVATYSLLSASLWRKNRQLALVMAGAAAISLGTSLMATES